MQSKSNVFLILILSVFICSNALQMKKNKSKQEYSSPCPKYGWCMSDYSVMTNEYVRSGEDWYLVSNPILGHKFTSNSDVVKVNHSLGGQYEVPYWKSTEKNKCLTFCGNFYNELKKTSTYKDAISNWHCDYSDRELSHALGLTYDPAANEYQWNCYFKLRINRHQVSRQYSIGLDKPNGNQMIIGHLLGKNIHSIDYNFWSPFLSAKYCNWFCGMVNRKCAEIKYNFTHDTYYIC